MLQATDHEEGLLAAPDDRRPLDWEDFDLLRTAGRQAASSLAELASRTEALKASDELPDPKRKATLGAEYVEKNLATAMPKAWQEPTDESDYDLIALTLDGRYDKHFGIAPSGDDGVLADRCENADRERDAEPADDREEAEGEWEPEEWLEARDSYWDTI